MRKVVLVDDYIDYVKIQKDFIEEFHEATCVTFTNPLEALEYILKEKDIDMLITDYEMPQMNGFMLAQKLIEKNMKLRIVISSGHDKRTLLSLAKQYNLEDKVEIITKGDIEFFIDLVT